MIGVQSLYLLACNVDNEALKDVSQRLSILLEKGNSEMATVSSQIQQLLPSMDKELAARRRIVESLYFRKMNGRRNNVSRAHEKTYQWILRPKESDNNLVWDEFLQWLYEPEYKPIYWIFGKPGCGKTTLVKELDERISREVESQTWYNRKDWLQDVLQDWVGKGDLLEASCYFCYAGSAEQKSLSGLLQSLAYQLLDQRPDLID